MTEEDAKSLVTEFLRTVERRDLEAVAPLIAPGFAMTFPGGLRHDSFEAMVASSATRYEKVAKRFETLDCMPTPTGFVVYCIGTLYGRWRGGEPFEGVRFIDRFEIVDGLIVRQDVWNDAAYVSGPA